MKKLLIAGILAAVSGYVYAQAPAVETKAAPAPASGIKVEKIVTAASVENKEPVDETSAFDKDTVKVYTWTKITAAATPAKIWHVYYFNEKKSGRSGASDRRQPLESLERQERPPRQLESGSHR